MRELVPAVYAFTGFVVGRVYCIRDRDGLTLIDCGIKQSAKTILAQLSAAGVTPGRVKRILITHGHLDHVGGLQQVQATTGAPVMVGSADRPVLEGQLPYPRAPKDADLSPVGRLMRGGADQYADPVPVARELADGDWLPEVLGGLQVIATPGHTPGHLAFWQPERRILFGGDVLGHWPTGLGLPPAAFTVDMAEDIRSLQRLAALEPDVLCLGHGAPILDNAAKPLRAFADRMADKA
ncbi:MAG: MBL fold metallo-hydrolase [Chloroflexota bacterium]|nr:MBL fold metallo-hydrolase [Chloroflexota bacterium]